ncbi:MAG TPA: hypothetical protein VIE43_23850 [Thermoanaerobaculia bacterium]|nr:hypothetical protein [Thermoanaerobaculia bacterium]
MVIGPARGPLARKLFVEPRRADAAWYLLRTFAPFTAKTPVGELAFQGEGKARAGAVEQRMILEWTRQVASEAANDHGESPYGLVLAWHQGSSSLDCQDLVVFRTGEVAATSCDWDGELHGRLDPAALARLYAWFDRLKPFQAGGGQTEESLRPGAFETRLVFAGQGARPAAGGDQAEILAFAAEIFAELAPKRGGAALPATPGPKPGSPSAAAPPAHLLLPPSALNSRPEEIALQLPEKAPPVPRPAPASSPSASSPSASSPSAPSPPAAAAPEAPESPAPPPPA